ncbi:hypothetical protein [Clostridium saccharoperbutylacetonicum]|uniref:hypothetical protein n=1 Tax=Clostridium saccharoperbutylacetonicum TaxID=36745 RepID=UPI0039E9B18A
MEESIKVYVKIDSNNIITQIDSSIFLFDVEGWIQIDEGLGDRYSHAQGNYLDKPLMDMQGKYNYKLMDGKIVELTEEEKEKLFLAPKQELSLEDRISMLENLQLQQEGVI